jgi:site-specific recombinase XerC
VTKRTVVAPPPKSDTARNAALLDAFAAHLATRPAHTRDAYLGDLRQLAADAGDTPLPALTRAQLARALATLHGRGLSGRSLARLLSAWRAFHRFLNDSNGANSEDPSVGLKPPKSPKNLPSALTPDEAVRLVDGAESDAWGRRDHALFELAYSSGLRLSELAGLDVDRVDLVTGEVRVWGKGAKERIVPVGAAARAAVFERGSLNAPRFRRWTSARCSSARAERASRRGKSSAGWRRSRSGAASTATCIRTCCVIPSRRTFCNPRETCARCRKCWAMRR